MPPATRPWCCSADPGTPGMGSDMHGAGGRDLTVRVPPGTLIRAKGARPEDPLLAEVVRPGDRALLVAGGRGGRGNLAFKSARNTAPAIAELGEKGAEMWVDLELKLVGGGGGWGGWGGGRARRCRLLVAVAMRAGNGSAGAVRGERVGWRTGGQATDCGR